MILELKNILFISLIGGLINLDTRALFQVMVSRPVITGPLIGFVIRGEEGLCIGLMIGAILELIWINAIPMGASIPANGSLSSTLGVATILFTNGKMEIVSMIALILCLLFSFVFMRIDLMNREFNNVLVGKLFESIKKGRFWAVGLVNLLAFILTFGLGSISLFVSIIICKGICEVLVEILPVWMGMGLYVAYYLLPIFGLGVAIEAFLSSKKVIPYFVVALGAGVIFGLAR